jgi:signal transduction histidine kinase
MMSFLYECLRMFLLLICLYFLICKVFLQIELSWQRKAVLIGAGGVSLLIISLVFLSINLLLVRAILCIVDLIILFTFITNVKFKYVISAVMYVLIMLVLTDQILVLLITKSMHISVTNINKSVFLLFIMDVSAVLVIILFSKCINIAKIFILKRKTSIAYIVLYIVITSFILLGYIIFFKYNKFSPYFILAITFFCSMFIVLHLSLAEKTSEAEALKMKNDTIEDLSKELRVFRHNIFNYLCSLQGYVELEKYDKLKDYLERILDESKPLQNTSVFDLQRIKVPPLFALIRSKLYLIKNTYPDIDFRLYVYDEITSINMKVQDLITVTGNMLDNAITACAESTGKQLSISITLDDNQSIVIEIQNTYNKEMLPQNTQEKSKRGVGRGLGLSIIENIVKKYSNVLNTRTITEEFFTQVLVIVQV